MGRVGQVMEVEETGAIDLAAPPFVDGASAVRKRKTREFLTITDSFRVRYTAPRIRVDTVEHERKGVVSIEHDELGAAQQELELRLRRRWGRAEGEPTGVSQHFALQQRSQRPRHDSALCRPTRLWRALPVQDEPRCARSGVR